MGEYDRIKNNEIKSLKPLQRGTSTSEYDRNWKKPLRRLTSQCEYDHIFVRRLNEVISFILFRSYSSGFWSSPTVNVPQCDFSVTF